MTNRIKKQTPNVKGFVWGKDKVAKKKLVVKIDQEQGEGSTRMGTYLQIYDGFPIVKIKQVSQEKWSMIIKVDLKNTCKTPTIKMKQVKKFKR